MRLVPVAVGAASLLLAHGCGEQEPLGSTQQFPPQNVGNQGDQTGGQNNAPPPSGNQNGGTGNENPGSGDSSGNGNGGGNLPASSLEGVPCEVQDVLNAACISCHSKEPGNPAPARFGAPMTLTSYADFFADSPYDASRKVHEAVAERINHPNPSKRMPPTQVEPLTAEQLEIFNDWLDQGAPRSTESCEPIGGDVGNGNDGEGCQGGTCPIDTTGLDCYEFTAFARGNKNAKYKVGSARDKYVAFMHAPPWQGTAYGITVEPLIRNSAVVHHWLLFKVAAGVQDGQVRDSIGANPNGELIHGWAPGGASIDFREHGDVGFEFKQGEGFLLELHYNSSDPNAEDNSGAKLCVQKNKPQNLAATAWVGVDKMAASTKWEGTCTPATREPVHILGVSPHMHLAGVHMKGVINRAGGGTTVLHDMPFNFNDQTLYKKNEMLMPGDSITVTCEYSEPKSFGQGTTQEMCYLFTVAYPAGALVSSNPIDAAWGRTAHGNNSCVSFQAL